MRQVTKPRKKLAKKEKYSNRWRKLNRAILDRGWGEFIRQLEYKLTWICLDFPNEFWFI